MLCRATILPRKALPRAPGAMLPRFFPRAMLSTSSSESNTSRVYASTSETPLVRTEFLADKRIFVLHLLGEETQDNRLTHTLIQQGLVPALRDVRRQWYKWVKANDTADGAALVTTALPTSKIFSNGLDLLNALKDPNFFNESLNVLSRELLTFPIPTVAAMGGHAFAAGFTFALAHDYRVMNAQRGYACMNEIEFGAHIPRGMLGVIQSVASSASLQRKIVLEGHRFTAAEAMQDGLVDATAEGAEATFQAALALAEKLRSRCAKDAWQINREQLKREAIEMQYEPPRAQIKTEVK